jgi:hypothetical protein
LRGRQPMTSVEPRLPGLPTLATVRLSIQFFSSTGFNRFSNSSTGSLYGPKTGLGKTAPRSPMRFNKLSISVLVSDFGR